jgi:hypothetical protein
VDKGVWEVIENAHLTKKQLKSVIRSSMFIKEKFNGNGSFDKLKARLVAGGDGLDKSLYDNLSSLTVAQETVMMIAIAATEKTKVASINITGAYLEFEIAEDGKVIMMLDPTLTSITASKDPCGKLYVKLKRALFGCIQSAKLWYKSVLVADGYVPNDYDGCLFNKTTGGGQQITVAFHVDGHLVTCQLDSAIEDLVTHLQCNFKEISWSAMNLEVDVRGIHLDIHDGLHRQVPGREKHQKTREISGYDLFNTPEESEALSEVGKKMFHSDVAKLLYLATRTTYPLEWTTQPRTTSRN